jgi:hypothetical protein
MERKTKWYRPVDKIVNKSECSFCKWNKEGKCGQNNCRIYLESEAEEVNKVMGREW